MSLNRGKREDTEGVRETEFIVLDFIRSTPNATIPEIARLIDDVGADVNYVANELGIDPAVALQAYNEVINVAPPIEQVIEKQTNLQDVIDTSGATGAVVGGNPIRQSQETREREQTRIADIEAENARLAQVDTDRAAAAQRGAEARAQAADTLRGQIADQGASQVLSGLTSDGTSERAALMNLSTSTGIPVTELERTFQATSEPSPAPGATALPVGLAASEKAIRDAEEKARQDLLTTYNISRGDLERGAIAASEVLAGGTRRARTDIKAGTQRGLKALREGLGGARTDIEAGFGRAERMFDPYTQAGQNALQQQQALSGALGQEAFQQAYQESPQMQFLREQGEQAALRTASARGGLGGGRVMQELARYGTGLASQDLQNQISNLQALSSQGLGATGSAASIATGGASGLANLGVQGGTSGLQAYTQQGANLADLAQQLGVRGADILQALGAGQSNIALGLGTRAADLSQTMGTNIAGMRTRAGELLAGQFGTAASQIAALQQAQGAGTANMLGAQTNYINQLQQAAAAGDAASQTELAQLQAQGYSNIGSQLAGVPQAQTFVGQSPMAGALGGAVIGSQIAEMFPSQQPAQSTFRIGSGFAPGYFSNPMNSSIMTAPQVSPMAYMSMIQGLA